MSGENGCANGGFSAVLKTPSDDDDDADYYGTKVGKDGCIARKKNSPLSSGHSDIVCCAGMCFCFCYLSTVSDTVWPLKERYVCLFVARCTLQKVEIVAWYSIQWEAADGCAEIRCTHGE